MINFVDPQIKKIGHLLFSIFFKFLNQLFQKIKKNGYQNKVKFRENNQLKSVFKIEITQNNTSNIKKIIFFQFFFQKK